jgi:hypothetical protein
MHAARQEAKRLLTLIRLPPTARRSAREPAGAGAALASNMVSIPSVSRLVELHEYFVVPSSTPAAVIAWLKRHRPTGSSQDDSGGGSAGERWTSFAFGRDGGFAIWPELVTNAVTIAGGDVALRVDVQVAPRPRLPSSGRGAGDLRVVELDTTAGSFGYTLRCGPPGGTVPDASHVCAAIVADPALLYSFPGPDHSCPLDSTVSLRGTWDGRPLHSTFSECTGGQERQAARWAALLPSVAALSSVHVDRGIGLVQLGEREAPVVDLLRARSPAPPLCDACTRKFRAGFSIGFGPGGTEPAGWTVSFSQSTVTAIAGNFGLTVDGAYAPRGFASLRRAVRGWTVRRCGARRELVHRSAYGTTVVAYDARAFERVLVSSSPVPCGVARSS